MTQRIKDLVAAYGRLAIIVHFSVLAATILAFTIAIEVGLADRVPWMAERLATTEPGGSFGAHGVALGSAYVLSKLMMFPRLAVTVAITTVLGRMLGRGPARAEA